MREVQRVHGSVAIVLGLAFAAILLVSQGPLDVGRLEPADTAPTSEAATIVHRSGTLLPSDAFPGPLPAFEERYVADQTAMEPSVAITRTGAAFYPLHIVDEDTRPGHAFEIRWMRSADDGLTWTDVTPPEPPLVPFLPVPLAEPITPTYLSFQADNIAYADSITGRIFTSELVVLRPCNHQLSFSDDDGATWTTKRLCSAGADDPDVLWDHQHLFTSAPAAPLPGGYPSVLYICNWGPECFVSLDGGETLHARTEPFGDVPMTTTTAASLLGTRCEPLVARGAGSPTTSYAYLAALCDGAPTVSVTSDHGATWTEHTIAPAEAIAGIDIELALDADDNLYALWMGPDDMPYLAASPDHGATWTSPTRVAPPGLTATRLPAIVAGDAGRVAIHYIGTDVPGGFGASEEEMLNARWHSFVTLSLDALATDPMFATAMANAPTNPIKRGECGDFCSTEEGNLGEVYGMYDYTSIAFSPTTGAVWVSFVDLCVDACEDASANGETYSRGRGAVGVQIAGTPLKG